MEKHFKLTEETIQWQGHALHRIEATRDSQYARAGQRGGFVEREYNLQDEAWVAVYFALSLTAGGGGELPERGAAGEPDRLARLIGANNHSPGVVRAPKTRQGLHFND